MQAIASIDAMLHALVERVRRDQRGQTAIEYGLVLALIAVVIVATVAAGLGPAVTSMISKLVAGL